MKNKNKKSTNNFENNKISKNNFEIKIYLVFSFCASSANLRNSSL